MWLIRVVFGMTYNAVLTEVEMCNTCKLSKGSNHYVKSDFFPPVETSIIWGCRFIQTSNA